MTPPSSPVRQPVVWEYEIGFPLVKTTNEKNQEIHVLEDEKIMPKT